MKEASRSQDWSKLLGMRRKLIGCATVIEEMAPFLPADVPSEVLDFGLHLRPEGLRSMLQQRIDEVSPEVDVILLGYGLCSMAVAGLMARSAYLVIPRTDDCISLFLGSSAAYQDQHRLEPGTYYLTKGWIEVGDTPFSDHQRMVEKFGPERAERMTALTLKNYQRLALINTGQKDIERYREYAQKTAAAFHLRFDEIEGSPALVKKLIFGPWDQDVVVVEPGQRVHFEDFLRLMP